MPTRSDGTAEIRVRGGRSGLLRPLVAHPWWSVSIALGLWVLLLSPVGMPLEWDEAVFFSRSGGLDGVHAPPVPLVPSRELGTPGLIALLRALGARDLATVRLFWALVAFGLTLVAFRAAARQVGGRAALVGFVIFVTAWFSTIFFFSFYGSLIGAAAALLSTMLYLRLRDESPERLLTGLLLGAALALMLWMRYLESFLVAAVLVVHALAWRPTVVLQRWRALAVSLGVVVLTYAVPFLTYTVARWGGPRGWIVASRHQNSGGTGHAFGLLNHVGNYFRIALGLREHYAFPRGPGWVTLAALVGVLGLIAAVGWRVAAEPRLRRSDRPEQPDVHLGLLLVLCALSFGVFFFFSATVRERYLLYGLVFAAVLVGIAIDALVRVAVRDRGRVGIAALTAGVVAVCWLLTQAHFTSLAQHSRLVKNRGDYAVGVTIDSLRAGRDCVLFGAAVRPQLVVRSRCKRASIPVVRARGVPKFVGRYPQTPGVAQFILWRPSKKQLRQLDGHWHAVKNPGHLKRFVLSYRFIPPSDSSA